MKKKTIALLFITFLFTVPAFKCKGPSNVPDAIKVAAKAGNGTVVLSHENNQGTPNGTRIIGKFEMSAEQLQNVDAAMTSFFDAARADGLTNKLYAGFYEVYTPPYRCMPSPIERTPSFLVRADTYDGTEFDQYNSKGVGKKDNVGVVYAAEMVLSLGTDTSNWQVGAMYVCPDLPIFGQAVRHGADHIVLANNPNVYTDGGAYFWCSLYHFDQGYGAISHPLIPRDGRCINYQAHRVEPFKEASKVSESDGLQVFQGDTSTIRPTK